MSNEDQAQAYLLEAQYTFESARVIFEAASQSRGTLWAQVVKNAYDAIEQAVSAAIATTGERIPRKHPAKINRFLDLFDPDEKLETILLHWLRRRSESQYVDIRGDEIYVPHEQFDRVDAEQIVADTRTVIQYVTQILDLA